MNTPSTENPSATSPAGRSPEEIERQIDGTREELSRTLDALQARLSVKRRFNEAADTARRKGARLMRSATASVTPGITTLIRMDHTYVLAVFRRFKPHATDGKKHALVANACLAMEVHTQLEKEIFYPALREAAGSSDALDKSVSAHDEMGSLIATLRSMQPGDASYDETFRSLMRVVLHHVADEETTLLPQAEQLLGDKLGVLGRQMTKRRMELLKPHAAEMTRTAARAFPVASATAVAGVLALGWLAIRPRRH